MSITGVSDVSSFLIQEASSMKGTKVQQEIQVAVLKQTMNQQKEAGEAIVRTLQDSAMGSQVDISV